MILSSHSIPLRCIAQNDLRDLALWIDHYSPSLAQDLEDDHNHLESDTKAGEEEGKDRDNPSETQKSGDDEGEESIEGDQDPEDFEFESFESTSDPFSSDFNASMDWGHSEGWDDQEIETKEEKKISDQWADKLIQFSDEISFLQLFSPFKFELSSKHDSPHLPQTTRSNLQEASNALDQIDSFLQDPWRDPSTQSDVQQLLEILCNRDLSISHHKIIIGGLETNWFAFLDLLLFS